MYKHAWVKPLIGFEPAPNGPAGAIDNGPPLWHPQRYAEEDVRHQQAHQLM